ncbi:MAG: HNH endonuclease [Arenicella sp.]
MIGKFEKCVLCEINEASSKEHIIPSAIGGKKTVIGFICESCNNETGTKWDAKLISQLHPLSVFFDIKPDRGKLGRLKTETTSGEKILYSSGGKVERVKPEISRNKKGNLEEIQIIANNEQQAREVLNGLSRKRDIDIDSALQSIIPESNYMDDMVKLNLEFGGIDQGKSIVKTALAMAFSAGVDLQKCNTALGFLKDKKVEPPFGYYHENDLIQDREKELPIHCVHIQSNEEESNLCAYIEYFGVRKIIVCLSENYSGKPVYETYAIDPTSGKELKPSITMNFSNSDLHDIYRYKYCNQQKEINSFSEVFAAKYRQDQDNELKRAIEVAISKAFDETLNKFGNEPSEDANQFCAEKVIENLNPYIKHILGIKR